MRLVVHQHDQLGRQPAIAPGGQASNHGAPLPRFTNRVVTTDCGIDQPAEREIGMVGGPPLRPRDAGLSNAPRADLRAIPRVFCASLRCLEDDGADRRLRLVKQLSKRPSDHIADPSRSVQFDQLLETDGARPGQTQRPTDSGVGHALSIVDGLDASTRNSHVIQRLSACPSQRTWTPGGRPTPTNLDVRGAQNPVQGLGHPHLRPQTGIGHA